jgi:uncharacterized protein YcnI
MTLSLTRLPRRVVAAVTIAGLGTLLFGAAAASAHVRVKPDSTVSGSYAGLTFRVPNESDTASTTKLVLTLPQDKPLAHVSVRPVPGWTATVTQTTLPKPVTANGTTLTKAPRTVTWTATSPQSAVAPGQYQEFSISAGPLPAPGAFVLPVAQSYSDGTVVNWDTAQVAGQKEPEHPAPQFDITPAAPTGEHASTADVTLADVQTGANASDPWARTLGGAALVMALAAVVLELTYRRRTVAR